MSSKVPSLHAEKDMNCHFRDAVETPKLSHFEIKHLLRMCQMNQIYWLVCISMWLR